MPLKKTSSGSLPSITVATRLTKYVLYLPISPPLSPLCLYTFTALYENVYIAYYYLKSSNGSWDAVSAELGGSAQLDPDSGIAKFDSLKIVGDRGSSYDLRFEYPFFPLCSSSWFLLLYVNCVLPNDYTIDILIYLRTSRQ